MQLGGRQGPVHSEKHAWHEDGELAGKSRKELNGEHLATRNELRFPKPVDHIVVQWRVHQQRLDEARVVAFSELLPRREVLEPEAKNVGAQRIEATKHGSEGHCYRLSFLGLEQCTWYHEHDKVHVNPEQCLLVE